MRSVYCCHHLIIITYLACKTKKKYKSSLLCTKDNLSLNYILLFYKKIFI